MNRRISQEQSKSGKSTPDGTEQTTVFDYRKMVAVGFSLMVLGSVLWPVNQNFRSEPRDDFPLSYYPMFSKKRSETVRITYILGVDDAGQEHRIKYCYAGSGGMNQIRKQLKKAVCRGETDQMCRKIASRVAVKRRKKNHPLSEIDTILMVTAKHRVNDYFVARDSLDSMEVQSLCKMAH